MEKNQDNQYAAIFTPRFHLSDTSLVGMEVRIKYGQRILPASETFNLILSGNNKDLLGQISAHFSHWSSKTENPLYLSWELCSKIKPEELRLFLDELSAIFPLKQLEIVLDTHDLTASESIKKARELFTELSGKSIRRGLFHSRLLDFDTGDICANVDLFKLKNGVIQEMKDDVATAAKCHYFIERLTAENISIVVDDLYYREDVTGSILMGIQYGQGYFLSRNKTEKRSIKPRTLRRKTNSDFYERRFDCFSNLMWT
jgi:hypothetical protein